MNLKMKSSLILIFVVFLCFVSFFVVAEDAVTVTQVQKVGCKENNDCIEAGLLNHYCRDSKYVASGLRYPSECEQKRGFIK